MKLPPEQEAIRDKCFHPSGTFVEFPKEEIEQSIPERFEKIVRLHPGRLAVKMGERALTYDELNKVANQIARAILVRRGQGSEPIALLFEHGIEVVAAIEVHRHGGHARLAGILDAVEVEVVPDEVAEAFGAGGLRLRGAQRDGERGACAQHGGSCNGARHDYPPSCRWNR